MDFDTRFLLVLKNKSTIYGLLRERSTSSSTKVPFAILGNTAIQTTTPLDRVLVAATTGAPLNQLSAALSFLIAKRFKVEALIVPCTIATTEPTFLGSRSIAASSIDRRTSTIPTYFWLDAPPATTNARNQLVVLCIPTFFIALARLTADLCAVIIYVLVAAVGTALMGIIGIVVGERRVFGCTSVSLVATYAPIVLA